MLENVAAGSGDIQSDSSDGNLVSQATQHFTAIVLVDYDNIRPIAEQATNDAADNLIRIREWIADALTQIPVKVNEVSLRIYGGWTDEQGTLTRKGNWVLASLSNVRGLLNGVRYLPYLPISIAAKQLRLKGLYRTNRSLPEQKMVDTLMAVDALHFCEGEPVVLAIATDDDDLVPVLLAASMKHCKACCLLRFRRKGEALNDEALDDQGVRVIKLGALPR